jgi:hypothetical protein
VRHQPIHGRHRGHWVLEDWSHFEQTRLLLTSTLRFSYRSARKVKSTSLSSRDHWTYPRILVSDHDGVPAPKVIDFGSAKANSDQPLMDKTLFTVFEQFMGTPAYMSLHQAKLSGLDVDSWRSDVEKRLGPELRPSSKPSAPTLNLVNPPPSRDFSQRQRT